jgi:hypothetical protein
VSELTYYAQCPNGHVMEVVPGSELESECKTRADKGAMDAIGLNADECPECLQDKEDADRRFANTCAAVGDCAFMDDRCSNGCMAQREVDSAKSSPYAGQLRGLMPTS